MEKIWPVKSFKTHWYLFSTDSNKSVVLRGVFLCSSTAGHFYTLCPIYALMSKLWDHLIQEKKKLIALPFVC